MQITTRDLEGINISLAEYYLGKLRRLEAAYQQGHEHSHEALLQFDKEWPQIQRWHDWLVSRLNDERNARLCISFSLAGMELLRLRQHPQNRLEWLETGLEASQQIRDERGEMLYLYLLARVHTSLSNLQASRDYAEAALKLAEKHRDSLQQGKILITLSNTHYNSSDYAVAYQYAAKALKLCKALDAKQEIGAALNALANVELSQSKYQAAYGHYLDYLNISESLGRPHEISLALHNLSNITEIIGMREEALGYALRCAELSRQTGNHYQLATSLGMLGFLSAEAGQLKEAESYLHESLKITQRLGLAQEELHTWGRIGNLRLLLGEYESARQAYQSALSLSYQGGFRHFAALSLACIIQVHRALDENTPALRTLREGLELIAELQMQSIQIVFLHEIAHLWLRLGREQEAAQYVGILEDNMQEFDEKDRQDFMNLCEKLEGKLGKKEFSKAKRAGKAANLETLFKAIHDSL